MERRYKPLLPAASSSQARPGDIQRKDSTDTTSDPGRQDSPGPRRKRVQVKLACDACRAKKTACDGQRPVCAPCSRRQLPCIFSGRPSDSPDEHSQSQSEVVELLNLLRSSPGEDALKMLDDIKTSGGDFKVALAHIKEKRLLALDYQQIHSPALPDQDSIEFELMARHPILYPAEIPLDRIPNVAGKHSRAGLGQQPVTAARDVGSDLVDPRLALVDFQTWTAIPIDSSDAAMAISRYLDLDHDILGLFDPELFLQDLVWHGTEFCSPLLVNALLGWTCLDALLLTDSQEPPSSAFFAAALDQWDSQPTPDSYPTLAALQLLSLTALFAGNGRKSRQLHLDAIDMGTRMRLMVNSAGVQEPLPGLDSRAASQAAWGLFSYATIYSLHSQRDDLRALTPPSALLIPARSTEKLTPELGATATPSTRVPFPTFPYLCQLWILVREVVHLRYREESPKAPILYEESYTQGTLQRLLSLGDQLPLSLARGNKTTPSGMILHIFFHVSIIMLVRPLVRDGNMAMQAVNRASINQLRRLITTYLVEFTPNSPSCMWHIGCLYLANDALKGSEDRHMNTRLSDLRLCLSGYGDLYPRYPMILIILKGLLRIAVDKALVTTKQAIDWVSQLETRKVYLILFPTEAGTVLDLDLALDDRHRADIDYLAQEFDAMVIFDELIIDEADDGTFSDWAFVNLGGS
ncbi:hypothetical protein GMORB2_7276 [Geosmithia morbida]|uniref:Zn(2)-C6 fungal-type domain-containing protein n=1 Tax=Geosmithia morbida TaxID=1094350 RepID=A0A9P5D5A2_9HYPO|nr:uncharacterized protein GMORB2_7276 [Geosmithia morbida]KAF4122284.1 hypothetical protein GMORB2_7276 [Geosmithia morbida]